MSLEDEAKRIADVLVLIAGRLGNRLPQPKPFTVRLISERKENEVNLLTYEATLPTVPAGSDTVGQTLTVLVDDAQHSEQELGKDATTAQFEVPQDSEVKLLLVYKDDGGNLSDPRTQTFVAKDTIGPDQPGDFGAIRLISERVVPDA